DLDLAGPAGTAAGRRQIEELRLGVRRQQFRYLSLTSGFSVPSASQRRRFSPARSLPYTWISIVSRAVGLYMPCTSSPGTRRDTPPAVWRVTLSVSSAARPGPASVTPQRVS